MKTFLSLLVARFEGIEAELNALDAATGDGDHGATMLKGLKAAVADDEQPARAFRTAAGGASGSLFGLLIGAIERVEAGKGTLGSELARAAERVSQMGQAKQGDKTMLDALIPAAEAGDDPGMVAASARAGLETTRDMKARRGRAKYVEGAGEGHLDAGARSVAEILTAYAEWDGRK